VRYDIGFGELNAVTSADGEETWSKRARASFRVSTWSDTEYGPLRTYVETRWQYDTNGGADTATNANPQVFDSTGGYTTDGEFSINFAYIDLAGLRIGKDESFFTTFTDYAGAVISDDLISYGPFDTNLISYTFNSGAFSAGISFEQGNNSSSTTWVDTNGDGDLDPVITVSGWAVDDYMPHIVAGAGYDGGAFQVRGVVGYDTRDGVNQGGWSGKIRGDVSFDPFSAFVMVMYGENTSAYTGWATGAITDETLAVIGGASFDFTDAATLNAQVSWADGNGGSDQWAAVANINYELVDGFIVRPEIAYFDNGTDDAFGGTLRFQRSF
ncbi:MAG: porin, partial [Roseitalea sp.]|nr:porin [Roseitalea sp.]MBO6720646.1 porin [Roseitalea sp.]MBO6743793.1 porin [Roseitalea sp.]